MTDRRRAGRRGPALSGTGRARRATLAVAAALVAALAAAGCARQSPPQKPLIHTTRTFDAIFGELPPIAVPGPCYAAVVYFPSSREPGKLRPVPVFSAGQGQEERLAVRTAIRGVGEAGTFSSEIVPAFPPGADLAAYAVEGGVARITVGGTFRAADFPPEARAAAAASLALTAAQFGKAREVDVTDAAGTAHFGARADERLALEIGPPQVIGLLAVKEKADRPATALSVLFDRPVFLDNMAIVPPGGDAPVSGAVYATGFGMAAELHPAREASLNIRDAYRVKVEARDGKGRRTSGERSFVAREKTRD